LTAIRKECKDKDFDTTLNELEDTLRKAQDQKGVLDSSEVLFRRYISSLKQKDPCCPLCHRNFQAAKETEKLIAEVDLYLNNHPNNPSYPSNTPTITQLPCSR
jgi:DNA repair protein RAD50